ncbi:tetratricopeptide repeat protein [Zoogloea sp.]|uniref:serine protease n=1 Tax=Zoogloea sp. TaxID=49181 RepID=UPI0035B45E89
MKPMAWVLAGALGATSGMVAAETDDAKRVFSLASPSVVTVRTEDDKGVAEGQGSGVVVAPQRVVTNCHVIENAPVIRVFVGDKGLPAVWLRRNAIQDLCLLQVDGLGAASARLREGAVPAVGEPVFAVGNPLGFGLAVSAGLVAVAEQAQPQPYLVSTAPQSPGSSGGGLFDREGRLVGVTRAILGTGQNLNMAMSAAGVAALLAGGDVPPPPVRAPAPEKPWLADAEALIRSEDWGALETHARAWMVAQPGSAPAHAALGQALLRQQRLPEAEAALRRALEIDPFFFWAWTHLALVQYARGEPVAAEASLAKLDVIHPANSESAVRRAEWLRGQKRLEEARVQAKEAVRRSPGWMSAWRLLGQIEDEMGHHQDAVRALAAAARLGEVDGAVRSRLAELYAQSGKVEEASRLSAGAEGGRREQGRTQLVLGLGELNRGRLGPAEEAMRKAVDLAPGLADAWSGLAVVLMRLGRPQEAEAAAEKAVDLAPTHADMLANRAGVRMELNKLPAAIQDAHRAVELDPKSLQGWRMLSLAYLKAGKPREAAMAFQKLDGLGSMTPDELVSWAEAMIGTGNPDQALVILRRAEAADPKLLRMCLTTAKALGAKGDPAGALAYEERALEIDPVNVLAWSGKGYALMRLGRLSEAIEPLETAVRLDPNMANAWINLGEAQLRSRNLGRAIQSLEKALTLSPTAQDARYYLAQAYLGARLPRKARENAQTLLEKQPGAAPVMTLVVLSHLMENNISAATESYQQLFARAPEAARKLRGQAVSSGVAAARDWPE